MFEKKHIVSLHVHQIGFEKSLAFVMNLSVNRIPSYICFANVHMVMEASRNKNFLRDIENSTLVLPDGKPIALAFNILYHKKQERISGMDFMPRLLSLLNQNKCSVFFYGSTTEVLKALQQKITLLYPDLIQAGFVSPPFEEWNNEDILRDIESINNSGAQAIFISLGCPKQEKWMAAYSEKINGVLLGVGGAFPVVAGLQKRAPSWMQNMSLEWFYRLCQQPKRLFKRYFSTNLSFILLLTRQWFKKQVKHEK